MLKAARTAKKCFPQNLLVSGEYTYFIQKVHVKGYFLISRLNSNALLARSNVQNGLISITLDVLNKFSVKYFYGTTPSVYSSAKLYSLFLSSWKYVEPPRGMSSLKPEAG